LSTFPYNEAKFFYALRFSSLKKTPHKSTSIECILNFGLFEIFGIIGISLKLLTWILGGWFWVVDHSIAFYYVREYVHTTISCLSLMDSWSLWSHST